MKKKKEEWEDYTISATTTSEHSWMTGLLLISEYRFTLINYPLPPQNAKIYPCKEQKNN